jgi:hypothetical protein
VRVEAAPRLLLGSLASTYLLVEPMRYAYVDAKDYWDGNWVRADVRIVVGAFRGQYEALLRADEFADFREQLGRLHETLKGEASFQSMEDWLRVHVAGDGRGHFTADCVSRDRPGTGSRLSFQLEFDQTQVPAMLRDLDELLRRFPVRGER